MLKTYKLIASRTFLKDLEKLPSDIKSRVEKTLIELTRDPYSARDLKKLANVELGRWRLRIGDYRLRYDIVEQEIRLRVIRHRKDIYHKREK
jgi:mRNA interferase RelE/StbE